MGYFVVIVVILINVVFGVILKSFEELHDNQRETKELIRTKCFICDINRKRFDLCAEGISIEYQLMKNNRGCNL